MYNRYSFHIGIRIPKLSFSTNTPFNEITDVVAVVVNIEPIAALTVI